VLLVFRRVHCKFEFCALLAKALAFTRF
jgi:hypothetical protein